MYLLVRPLFMLIGVVVMDSICGCGWLKKSPSTVSKKQSNHHSQRPVEDRWETYTLHRKRGCISYTGIVCGTPVPSCNNLISFMVDKLAGEFLFSFGVCMSSYKLSCRTFHKWVLLLYIKKWSKHIVVDKKCVIRWISQWIHCSVHREQKIIVNSNSFVCYSWQIWAGLRRPVNE